MNPFVYLFVTAFRRSLDDVRCRGRSCRSDSDAGGCSLIGDPDTQEGCGNRGGPRDGARCACRSGSPRRGVQPRGRQRPPPCRRLWSTHDDPSSSGTGHEPSDIVRTVVLDVKRFPMESGAPGPQAPARIGIRTRKAGEGLPRLLARCDATSSTCGETRLPSANAVRPGVRGLVV